MLFYKTRCVKLIFGDSTRRVISKIKFLAFFRELQHCTVKLKALYSE